MKRAIFLTVAVAALIGLFVGSVFADQETLAAEFDGAVEHATGLRVHATILAKAGDFITADEVFTQSIEVARSVSDPRSRDWTLMFIATAQARAGSVYAALDTAKSIEIEAYQHWALRDIAPMQAAAGDLSGALETASIIPAGDTQSRAFGRIALQQVQRGDVMLASLTVDRITVPEVKFRTYVAITRAMAGHLR